MTSILLEMESAIVSFTHTHTHTDTLYFILQLQEGDYLLYELIQILFEVVGKVRK